MKWAGRIRDANGARREGWSEILCEMVVHGWMAGGYSMELVALADKSYMPASRSPFYAGLLTL